MNRYSNPIDTILKEKSSNLQKINSKILSSDKNLRPNCAQILEACNEWSLSSSDFSEDFLFKRLIIECLKPKSKKKSFSHYFVEQKLKNYNWGKCIKRYHLKNFYLIHLYIISVEYLGIPFKGLNFNCGDGKYNQEFEEMNLIAFGNYGIVCKAINRKSNAIFAIKKIPFNEGLSDSALKEIQFLQNLRSHLICRLESVWVENNYLNSDDYKTEENKNSISNSEIFKPNKVLLLHIQMEFCLMTLRDVSKKLNNELNRELSGVMTTLGYYISSQLFEEILESVDYLHKQKVIHRDLKPNNILITDGMNGRFVKIADFGLATIHEFDGQSHTKYKGTQRYVAPEVMRRRNYDMKADIYSLGVILQELFNIDINEYLKYKSFFNFIISYFLLNFRPIGEGSKLENKYLNLFELSERMTSSLKNRRPNCDEILLQKHLWSLNLTELQNDSEFKSKEMQFTDNTFHSNFIKMKSEMSSNFSDLEINYN